jgi:hypothetical protein
MAQEELLGIQAIISLHRDMEEVMGQEWDSKLARMV